MRGWNVVAGLVVLAVTGCSRSKARDAKAVGADLPVTSTSSVALPDATDAADAPHAPQVAESQRADLTTYRDPTTGVSFQYPTVWRPAVAGQSPVNPDFEQVAGKARITQEFLPNGNPYALTVLRGLMFSYTVKAGSNGESCAQLAKRATPDATVKQASYGGVPFSEASGGDAAMCTHVQAQVDTTLKGSRCFVFERDFVTSCPYVKTKTDPRPLTGKEAAALQQSLDAVMQSVRIVQP